MSNSTPWMIDIGCEVHVQLNTNSKMFSTAPTSFGDEPNTHVTEVCLGLPGALPVPNQAAVDKAILFGLSIDATVNPRSVFARKNYFYPDLPKGYQISQHEHPIVSGGSIPIVLRNGEHQRIELTRAHLEEDAGKSNHHPECGETWVDLNRAGTPLLEIVSEPVMHSVEETLAYLKTLHTLVCCLGICDGNMQEGSFRCDANVSVRPSPESPLGTRVEIKNLNSFRFIGQAIEHEVNRQIALIQSGGQVKQETRLYDSQKQETRAMRSKEREMDYRYFPDPDLPPLVLTPARIDQIRANLPELPWARAERYVKDHQLKSEDARLLGNDNALAAYFETMLTHCEGEAQQAANWINGELAAWLHKTSTALADCPITPQALAMLVNRMVDGTISGKIAKTVFEAMWQGEGDPDTIIKARNLVQMTDTAALTSLIEAVVADHPEQLAQYRDGKDKLFGFFVGQIMKKTQGKANPQLVNEILEATLKG